MPTLREQLKRYAFLVRLVRWFRQYVLHQTPSPAEIKNAQYDQQTSAVMARTMSTNSVGVDGGAHQGLFLQQMCTYAPDARHHAFEPLPGLALALRNKFPEQTIHECALSDYNGTTSFKHVTNAPAYSGLRERSYDAIKPDIQEITVKVVQLDDVLSPEVAVSFIKLDLEGGEYHAIRGAKNTIARHKPVIVFEAGEGSSGFYGVTSTMIYELITEELHYHLSTMARWLADAPGFTREEFMEGAHQDFFFIAYPPQST